MILQWEKKVKQNHLSAYRASAIGGATHLDVLLACYDALAEDIRLAGQASEKRHVEERSRRTHHAMLLLGHLQDWVPCLQDPALQDGLRNFYEYVRAELVRLQNSFDQSGFQALSMRVCETRAAWQQRYAGDLPMSAGISDKQSEWTEGSRMHCSA